MLVVIDFVILSITYINQLNINCKCDIFYIEGKSSCP